MFEFNVDESIKISSILNKNDGIFVGFNHDDVCAHNWLVKELDINKGNLRYFFVETNHVNILAWHNNLKSKGFIDQDEELICPQNENPKDFLRKMASQSGIIFSFLYARYILKMEVVGVDEVSEKERLVLNQNQSLLSFEEKKQLSALRTKNDSIMQKNIKNKLREQFGQYVFLGGAGHIDLANLLEIPGVVFMSIEHILEKSINNKQEGVNLLDAFSEVGFDKVILYDTKKNEVIQVVSLIKKIEGEISDKKIPKHTVPEQKNTFSKKTDKMFEGLFGKKAEKKVDPQSSKNTNSNESKDLSSDAKSTTPALRRSSSEEDK